MDYSIQSESNFDICINESKAENNITLLHITAEAKDDAQKLNFRVRWQIPNIRVHATWAPMKFKNKEIVPNWGAYEKSCIMSSAPVYSAVSYDDTNRYTIACSDAKNTVEIHTGAIEENACLDCTVKIHVDYKVSHYEVDIRMDSREIPFYEAVDDVRIWWEGHEGYEPAEVPEAAYLPVYSTWYSYHQDINVDAIVAECRHFAKQGCKTIIVDDGWQCDNQLRGYSYCGDWKVVPSKVPDLKAFVDAVHEIGMKFMLWYSVPFVGIHSGVYDRFKDMMLYQDGPLGKEYFIVDPRYPEIREYLIGMYCQAVEDWGLDGFKLDFVDSFRQSDVVKEGMDYISVYDAVDRLLKEVIKTLKEMKPDILIEFRQTYTGPLMRTFGNMLRSMDCPNDSWTNKANVLSLRMTSGKTAVHSDMVMWNYDESAELAAFQLTNVLFSVPQISVRSTLMSERQSEMVKRYLTLWMKYRDTILHGKMMYKGYSDNYHYVSARSENVQVGAVYSGKIAYIEKATDEIILFNASMNNSMYIECVDEREYDCCVYDCCGKEMYRKTIRLQGLTALYEIPMNGTVVLNAI